MTALSLDELYTEYIEPLSPAQRLQLASMITLKEADTAEQEPPKKRSIMELRGLGAEIWAGIDAQEYVNELRRDSE